MTPEDRMRAAVDACRAMKDPFTYRFAACERHWADAIREAASEARRAALEEAAQMVEGEAWTYAETRSRVARRLRSLAERSQVKSEAGE